jgi:hypothetical protein
MSDQWPRIGESSGFSSRPEIAVVREEFEHDFPKVTIKHPTYSLDGRWHASWLGKGEHGEAIPCYHDADMADGVKFFRELREMMPADELMDGSPRLTEVPGDEAAPGEGA